MNVVKFLKTPFFKEHLWWLLLKVALAITGAMQGTSRDEMYQELRLELIKSRRWYIRLSCMFKILKKALNYLINLIAKCEAAIRIRNNSFPTYNFLLF